MDESSRDNGRVAIVTGAGNGIGNSVAKKFLSHGSTVVAVDMSEGNLKRLAGEVDQNIRKNLVPMVGNASDMVFAGICVEKASSITGNVDFLVNCAGGSYGHGGKRFSEMAEEDWKGTVEGNFYSALNFTRAVLPVMIRSRTGNIINMGSSTALGDSTNSGAGLSVYSAIKGGIISFTKAVAREVAEYGIRVNCVSPGLTRTEAMNRLPSSVIEELSSATPLGRICEPEDVANLVDFLVSGKSSFITGINVTISGGLVMY